MSKIPISVQYCFFLVIDIIKLGVIAWLVDMQNRLSLPFILGITALSMVPTIWLVLVLNESYFSRFLDLLFFIKVFMIIGSLFFILYTIYNSGGLLTGNLAVSMRVAGLYVVFDGLALITVFKRRTSLCRLSQ